MSRDKLDVYSAQSAFYLIMGVIPMLMLMMLFMQYLPLKEEMVVETLRQIIDENNAHVEQLRSEHSDVERDVSIFTRYMNLTEEDVAALIFAMRCAEAGVQAPVDERLRAVRDKALAEMKAVDLGSSRTFGTRPY